MCRPSPRHRARLGIHDLPACIDPRQQPNGVVIRVYRWRDGAVLRERHLSIRNLIGSNGDPMVETLAELDREDTWSEAGMGPHLGHKAVVLIGYDGDTGEAMAPPMLVTDDPALTGL